MVGETQRNEREAVDGGPRREFQVRRYFTQAGVDPFSTVEWERRSAVITGEKGDVVFEQHDVEIPKSLVAARDQRRRLQVLPRHHSAPRSASRASAS